MLLTFPEQFEPECNLWETTLMEKPHLVIIKEVAGSPIQGGCSSCEDIRFTVSGGFTDDQMQRLAILFREHFRTVHEREDVNQAKTREAGMLSPGEIAQIKAEIERLEKARKECTDSGIRQRIEAWIAEQKKKLES